MKLKLITQEKVTILSISEEILPAQTAILKAGVSKLFNSGTKTVILDLSEATKLEPPILTEVYHLVQLAAQLKGRLIIVSPVVGSGHVSTREEAIKLVRLDLSSLLATQATLNSQLEKLHKKKTDLNAKVSGAKTSGSQMKKLRHENSWLKSRVHQLESQIRGLLTTRAEVTATQAVVAKSDTVSKILMAVLEQEGILPVR